MPSQEYGKGHEYAILRKNNTSEEGRSKHWELINQEEATIERKASEKSGGPASGFEDRRPQQSQRWGPSPVGKFGDSHSGTHKRTVTPKWGQSLRDKQGIKVNKNDFCKTYKYETSGDPRLAPKGINLFQSSEQVEHMSYYSSEEKEVVKRYKPRFCRSWGGG